MEELENTSPEKEAFVKTMLTIESCKTYEQLINCKKMIDNYIVLHPTSHCYGILVGAYTQKMYKVKENV
jgi:hypothetical protein